MSPEDPRHGTPAGYDAHRADDEPACFACRRGAAEYEYRRRIDGILGKKRTQPGLGTARRIQALVALGWTYQHIGQAIGRCHDYPRKVAINPHTSIRTTTAELIAEAYERMSMTLPPQTTGHERRLIKYARSVAARNNWAPPLAWDNIDDPNEQPNYGGQDTDIDPVVVMRLLEGQRVKATVAEKEAAMERWVLDGCGSRNELARLHGWGKPERYTTRLRLVRGEAS